MNWNELKKDKKIFIIAGIPCYVFLSLFFATHYFQITVFFLMIMGIFLGGFLRKKGFWLRLTKVGVFMVIVYFAMFYNVTRLPEQFARRMPGERNALIEPNHPEIVKMSEEFQEWHRAQYGESFGEVPEDSRDEFEIKMKRVDYYVRYLRMEYKYDINPPYYYYDHLPTIDQIFESDLDGDGKLQDDCDGITIVTVSVLKHLGYDAWVAETEFHYFTLVFQEDVNPKTKAGYQQAVYLYNSRERPAYLMFNEEELILPPTRPFYVSAFEIFTGKILWESYFLGFFTGDYFEVSAGLLILLAVAIALVLSFVFTLAGLIGTSSLKQLERGEKRQGLLKLVLINAFVCSLAIFLLYFVSVIGMGALGNLILIGCLVSVFRLTDHRADKFTKETEIPEGGK